MLQAYTGLGLKGFANNSNSVNLGFQFEYNAAVGF